MEETMSQSFIRTTNLRNILSRERCPEALQNCRPIFDKLVEPQARDTLITDMMSFSEPTDEAEDEDAKPQSTHEAKPIEPDLRAAFQGSLGFQAPPRAQFQSNLTIGAATYSVSTKHRGNSCTLFKTDSAGEPVPGCIEKIFRVHLNGTVQSFVALRRHVILNSGAEDPFCRYPVLKARLWSHKLGKLEVVPIDAITSHFAKCCIPWNGEEATVVLSLSRVHSYDASY
jgi:hypothetical protein